MMYILTLLRKLNTNSIRSQIVFAFTSLIFIIVLLQSFSYLWIEELSIINGLKENISNLRKEQLKMKSSSSEFILKGREDELFYSKGESDYLKQYEQHLEKIDNILIDVNNQVKDLNLEGSKDLVLFQEDIYKYDSLFKLTIEAIKIKGYGKYGVIGEFDNAMMDLVQYDFGIDNTALLSLQLHVKEYLLGGNSNAITNVTNEIYHFSLVLDKYITEAQVETVIAALEKYESSFKKLVEVDNKIDKKSKTGLINQLYATMSDIDGRIELQVLIENINSSYSTIRAKVYLSFFLIVGLSALAAVIIYSRLLKTLVKPINNIRDIIVKVGEGEIPSKASATKIKEVNEMVIAVNKLLTVAESHQAFAQDIGKGNLQASFLLENEKDALGKALIEMRGNLRKVELENQQRAWATNGIAIFAEILREHHNELKSLGDKLITQLVKYLEVVQAGIYLIEDDQDDRHLYLLSCYAYDRKKFINQKISIGEGLLGQTILEKASNYLTDIPKSFFKIQSGLGEAEPKTSFIVPLIYNEIAVGAIEVASFHEIPEYKRNFLERLSENIASSIITANINNNNLKLLRETKEQSELMKMREEEMRQQMEELIKQAGTAKLEIEFKKEEEK